MKLSLLTVLALLLACSSSCAQESTKADGAWAQNRALWESKHIKDYDMVVERLQGGTYSYVPYLISVRDGKVANKTPARPNTGLEVVDSYEAVETVDKMFDTIRRGCEDRTEMKVEYDLVTGAPMSIGFTGNTYVADAGYAYRVNELTPLEFQ